MVMRPEPALLLLLLVLFCLGGGGAAASVSHGAAKTSTSTTMRLVTPGARTRASRFGGGGSLVEAAVDGSLAARARRRRRRRRSSGDFGGTTVRSHVLDGAAAVSSSDDEPRHDRGSSVPEAVPAAAAHVPSSPLAPSAAATSAFGVPHRRVPAVAFGLSSSSRRRQLLDDLRGGATNDEDEDEDEDEDTSKEDDDEDTSKEEDDDDSDREAGNDATDEKVRSGETIRTSTETAKDEDDGTSTSGTGHPMSTVMSMEPVVVVVKTGTGNPVLDQTVEFTVHPSRDVASVKQSLRRLLPGKPPVSMLRLVQSNVVLQDELMVNELLDDDDDEDDEQEDDDENDDEEGGRKKKKLRLQLDMVPPVDPKFVVQLAVQMPEMTVSDLLDAYAMNEAAAYVHASTLMATPSQQQDDDHDEEEEEESAPESDRRRPTSLAGSSVTQLIKEQAAKIRKDLEEALLQSDAMQKVLQESKAPAFHLPNLQERQVRGDRVRQTAQGGVTTTLKRKIQRNLNVNWVDTIRHFCLFLFFGYFGGRTPFSRAVLLLGAPSVFLLQARFVKLWIRQVLYALVDHPPSILLSLLPAPQQSILSLDVKAAMETIYGDYAVELRRRGAAATGGQEFGDNDEEEEEEDDDEDDEVEEEEEEGDSDDGEAFEDDESPDEASDDE